MSENTCLRALNTSRNRELVESNEKWNDKSCFWLVEDQMRHWIFDKSPCGPQLLRPAFSSRQLGLQLGQAL